MNDDEVRRKMLQGIERFGTYVGMALILEGNEGPRMVLRNGTISFVDTGSKKLLVTNAHVYEAYEKAKQEHPNALLAVTTSNGTPPINISSATVIDRIMNGVDLITLDFEAVDLIEKGGKAFYPCSKWPPDKAEKYNEVFLVGYAEIHRNVSARGLECWMTGICDSITASNERQFMLVDEDQKRRVIKMNPALEDFGPLSGMSGCAVFCQIVGTTEWSLCGFMYEASGESSQAIIAVNHAHFVQADGNLNRHAMPWLINDR